jgi:Fe-S cluster assembly iron-binding protein IscA
MKISEKAKEKMGPLLEEDENKGKFLRIVMEGFG